MIATTPVFILIQIRVDTSIFNRLVYFLAVGFGSGLAPKAPGTFGTLAAIPIYYVMSLYCSMAGYLVVTFVMAVAGIMICSKADTFFPGHDSSHIVWDEIVGFLITMIAVPLSWPAIIAGFICFRFFDILKPWPICWADRKVAGGLGIMLDDMLAGLMGLLVMQLLYETAII